MTTGELRGHPIYWDGKNWRYQDNGDRTIWSPKGRSCGFCLLPNRSDGIDACLGRLPLVRNACCGHGKGQEAYVQFSTQFSFRGHWARASQRLLIWVRDRLFFKRPKDEQSGEVE